MLSPQSQREQVKPRRRNQGALTLLVCAVGGSACGSPGRERFARSGACLAVTEACPAGRRFGIVLGLHRSMTRVSKPADWQVFIEAIERMPPVKQAATLSGLAYEMHARGNREGAIAQAPHGFYARANFWAFASELTTGPSDSVSVRFEWRGKHFAAAQAG